jgi:hypothetical protein
MSSKDCCDRSTRAGVFVVIAAALLLIVILCAMFLPGGPGKAYRNGRGDGGGFGAQQGGGGPAGRGLGEVM